MKQVQCVGEQIALFRSKTNGRIAAVDAFYPYLDANLGHEQVKGDRLQCPIYGWQLDRNGRVCESTRAGALITFLSLGSIVKFEFDIPRIGEITMFQTHTPVEALRQRVSFRWFAARFVPRLLISYVVGNWISQWRQDVEI